MSTSCSGELKTHLSGPPMPKFEANMNYIPPSPPSSMKQCNKSATVKFHMELLSTTTRKQSRSGATPQWIVVSLVFPRWRPVADTLTLSQTTKFRLFQTAEFADNNFKFDENGGKVLLRNRKHGGKRRNCSL